jgi:hypothetical protein
MSRTTLVIALLFVGCSSHGPIDTSVSRSSDAAADGPDKVTEYEGQACSTNPGDDPLLVCSTANDLACITTFAVVVSNPIEAQRWDGGLRPVYVCRKRCDPGGAACVQEGDVCCPGRVADGTTATVCVPRSFCGALHAGDGGPG